VQNLKLVEALVINSNDRCRTPRVALEGDHRKAVEKIVKKAMETRPKL
jgi:1-pyrroline-4-hydroxy-2-carboxylate deaminase